jgi:hypothetical protein
MQEKEFIQSFIKEFNLSGLDEDDTHEMINAISETIYKQFLQYLYDEIGEDSFAALQASLSMGIDFYMTSLKHLAPNHRELLEKAKDDVLASFKK